MSFLTEAQLFQKVIESSFLKNFVDSLVYPTIAYIEPRGLFGIPDLVIANLSNSDMDYQVIRSFAFEMKLSNWQRALVQAYKYRAFANFSFVVLDRSSLKPALKQIDRFVLSNIGLISVDNSGFLSVHYFPKHDDPYAQPLIQKLESMIPHEDIFNSRSYTRTTQPGLINNLSTTTIVM